MSIPNTRRDFLKNTALAGVGVWAGTANAQESTSPNEQIRFACIGVGGKGASDSVDAGQHGDVVGICDVDDKALDRAAKRFPKAKRYNDYRKMLDEIGANVDAVTVSTPDHSHAPAAAMAMRMGKHCFTQKPLTHSLYEAKRLGEIAAEMKVATQMGNQGTAHENLRKAASLIKAGVIGNVSEVHIWTNRPVWPQGVPRPETKPAPANVHWDLWIGPAKHRPYADGYHDFKWRGWWDFGTGALGDMGCHTMNMPFMALDMRDPTSVEANTSGHKGDSFPKGSKIKFEFPARGDRGPITMHWYDGSTKISADLLEGQDVPRSGSLIVGDKGKMYTPGDDGNQYSFLSEIEEPKVTYKRSPGHFTEFAQAIKGGDPAMSNFTDYAGPLTSTVLLGNLAVWADGHKVEWDAKNLKVTNNPGVDGLEELIQHNYRDGYTL
jgi:predicted dehydrogenase